MNKKIVRFVIVILCYSVAIAGIFCFIGYKIAYDRIENSAPALISQTFYATISDIQDNTLTVTGMEINDINFRGEFRFSVTEETKIIWRYTDILMAIIFPLPLQERFSKHIQDRYNKLRLFNYWTMKSEF